MNQYPGFVPMVVQQPYMVAMPTAISMSGGVGPALSALPQGLHPQVAAAHVAGAPVVTSSVVNAPGMASAVRAAHLSQGVGHQLPQGMGQLAAQGMGHLAAQGMGQHLGMASMAGMGQPPPHQGAMSLPMAKVTPQGLGPLDSRKRPWGSGELDKGKGGRFDNRWQSNPETDVEEPNIDDSVCVLDHFNSDLNLAIDPDGFGATVLLDPPGFCFTWAGARSTHGVCKGKVYYEVHILEHLSVDFGDDHQEIDPHVVRVGWSIDSSSFQLGEEPWSFGYGGTGKFSTNCRFSDYGQRFGAGDVIGAMLDLESRPASISFMKNGTWFGVAIPLHGFPVGSKDMALYPHVLLKNCKVKVNFGQIDAWFPPPQGFAYIGQLPASERVRGMKCPERKADCEMIMIVGLPGVGKTTWGINMQKNHPEKRYNIIGTDTLIDKMRVMGLPRKRNYHGRWEVLIEKATKCLNKLFEVASRRKRNYILDQTNVYASARRRKMKNFKGFFRIAGVLQPEDPEMERRSRKRTVEDGKVVPESAVLEMKANFSIPDERDNLFDRIDFIELPREKVVPLMEQYVREGQEKRPPREEVFRHDSRFQKKNDQSFGQQGSRPGQNQSPYGQRPMMGGPSKSPMMGGTGKSPMGQGLKGDPQWFSEGDGLLGRAPNQMDEPLSKRMKLSQEGMRGSQQQGGALDLLKQQYDEAEPQDSSQWNQASSGAVQAHDFMNIKEEHHWPPQETAMALGAGVGVHGTSLPPHLAPQGGALVVSHPPGTIPLTGALGTQPPPPPPPVVPGHLAQTAAGPAFVALTPLPPPGPPPAIVAVGGAGALGAAPPGFHAQLQQVERGGQQAWHHVQSSWQSDTHSSTTNTPTQSGADISASRREWSQQAGGDGQQDAWQRGQQQSWQDQSRDGFTKGRQQPWQRGSGAQQQSSWQGQEGAQDGSDKGGQQPWQGGSVSQQQQPWQSQDRSADRGNKSWQGSDSSIGGGSNWMQNQGAGDGSRSYDEGRDKYGGPGNQRDLSRDGGYDLKNQGYGGGSGDSSGRRFDDFSRPPPDSRGSSRSDDYLGGDGRGGRSFGSGSQSMGESGGNDRWGSQQRGGGNDRWSSSSSSYQDRHGPSDSGDSRWSGRQDGRDQGDRWGSRGQDRFSRDHDRGRDLDRSRDRDRGSDRDRERDRDRGSDRDRDRDRDRSGRDRDRDQDRDSYRDSYRDRERDRGSRDRDHDSSEPRQRRRKSKWDNPDDDAGTKPGGDSNFQQLTIKDEPVVSGYGDHAAPTSLQSGQQQNQPFFNRPGQFQSQQSEGNDGPSSFPPRGMNFSKPPPASSAAGPGGPSPSQPSQGNFIPKDRSSDLPSLLDVQFGNRPPPPPAAGRDLPGDAPKSSSGETSLLGPIPSVPPPRFQGNTSSGAQSQSSPMPNTSVPPPRDGPPPPPFGAGGPGGNRPPFQPGAGPRFSGPNTPEAGGMGGGQRPGFRMEGPARPMRPRNPQNFGGPPGSLGQMGGPPPNVPWNQNRFGGGGRGMPPRPRFDGPGGGRFPGGPGPMRWPRGPH